MFNNSLRRASTRSAALRFSQQPLRRTYASEGPQFPEGTTNSNRNLLIGATVGLPALAYFIMPSPRGHSSVGDSVYEAGKSASNMSTPTPPSSPSSTYSSSSTPTPSTSASPFPASSSMGSEAAAASSSYSPAPGDLAHHHHHRGSSPGMMQQPADRVSERKRLDAEHGHVPRYAHPETLDRDTYKPPFGQKHAAKRVDGPPDGRHHQALHDRERQW